MPKKLRDEALRRQVVSVRLPVWMLDTIANFPDRTAFIESAILAALKKAAREKLAKRKAISAR